MRWRPSSAGSGEVILPRMDMPVVRPRACFQGRGRLVVFLFAVPLVLAPLALATLFLDMPTLAFVFMGIPSLGSAILCLGIGFGEAVACIELREDGFSIRMPSYRGWFPFWPVQQLNAEWDAVTNMQSTMVHGRMVFLPFDYVLHRITTRSGAIVLLEPLPGLFRNLRGMSFGIPMHEIVAAIGTRVRCGPQAQQ